MPPRWVQVAAAAMPRAKARIISELTTRVTTSTRAGSRPWSMEPAVARRSCQLSEAPNAPAANRSFSPLSPQAAQCDDPEQGGAEQSGGHDHRRQGARDRSADQAREGRIEAVGGGGTGARCRRDPESPPQSGVDDEDRDRADRNGDRVAGKGPGPQRVGHRRTIPDRLAGVGPSAEATAYRGGGPRWRSLNVPLLSGSR